MNFVEEIIFPYCYNMTKSRRKFADFIFTHRRTTWNLKFYIIYRLQNVQAVGTSCTETYKGSGFSDRLTNELNILQSNYQVSSE